MVVLCLIMGKSNLEDFFWYENRHEFGPLKLTCEPFFDEEFASYFPVVFTKDGRGVFGAEPLPSVELNEELSRLKGVFEDRGYEISEVEYLK